MELNAAAKKFILGEQLNESMKIKYRNEIEVRRAEYAINKVKDSELPEVQTYMENQDAKIREAKFNIAQCDDTIKVLREMLSELPED